MKAIKYHYLVIENAPDVCEGIQKRMQPFANWHSLGYCVAVKEAIEKILHNKPHLLFLDWGLNGGSAFEVLQSIQNIPDYYPYIIFNTGFQTDNPEIPQEIINNYKIDKYLVKPIWETLRQNLVNFLAEAEQKINQQLPKKEIWVQDENGIKRLIDLTLLTCIIQHPSEPRLRSFYLLSAARPLCIPLQWNKCYDLLNEYQIDYFITKNRAHLAVKEFVEKFEKPFIRIKGLTDFKIDIVKEHVSDFEVWLLSK